MTTIATPAASRLAWIDWMRGVACILMFQTHCYDAWLGGEARNTTFLKTSQLLGTLPAPLFLFLAGVSFALVTDKLIRKHRTPAEITRTMLLRGAEILAFGFAFRLQEFLIAWGWAPWSDLVRVDVLNIIGISMMLMALLCGLLMFTWGRVSVWRRATVWGLATTPAPAGQRSAPSTQTSSGGSQPTAVAAQFDSSLHTVPSQNRGRAALQGRVTPESMGALAPVPLPAVPIVLAALSLAALIALLTPPLYTTHRPTWLPWYLESYIDGCHNLGAPQSWLFCIFPWSAFAFAGLAAGFLLFSDAARAHTTKTLVLFAVAGASAIALAYRIDHSQLHFYAVYDYWHTSPNFLMMRIGLLLLISFLTYAWCRWGLATRGFSPLIQLGQTSLLVYWVHIEFVYGRFSILPKRAQSIPSATRGLLEIFLFMLLLSLVRTRIDWKKFHWKNLSPTKRLQRTQPA
jgi:uncharacterized membrane protein